MPSINNAQVGETGYGLMRMTMGTQTSDEQAFALMRKSLELGSNFWNSGEFYGQPTPTSNLSLLARYFTKYPGDASKVVLSVKGAMNMAILAPDCSPAGIKSSIENILAFLPPSLKKIDFYEPARVDAKVPIETTMETLVEYVKDGTIGGIMLSECSEDTIRRAAKIHKISGVELEYSLFSLEIRTNGILNACRELSIPIIAYSPLGFGLLTGHLKSPDDLPVDDHRRHFERFLPENFDKNFVLVDKVAKLAKKNGITPGQLALEWLRRESKDGLVVVPIPGTTILDRLVENVERVKVEQSDLEELEEVLKEFQPSGGRYMARVQHMLYGDSAPLEK